MAKESSITELRDERTTLETRAKEHIALAKKEERKLNAQEETQVREATLRMQEINIEIAGRESVNAQEGRKHVVNKPMSIRKALLELSNRGTFSEDTMRMHEAGRRAMGSLENNADTGLLIPIESRAFTATSVDTEDGSGLIETDFLQLLGPLRDRLVLGEAGATFMTGLVGNIDLPSFTGSTALWKGENEAAVEGGGKFKHKTLSPKRLTSMITVSKQLLVQDSVGVEAMLRADIVASVADALEKAIFGNHATDPIKPDGFFTGVPKTATPFSWGDVVDMETAADTANLSGSGAYVMHTALRGMAKKLVKAEAGMLGFLLEENGTLNGYKALRSNSIAKDGSKYGIVFGNWAEYIVGQWGALDLTIDPYTRAHEAFVRIIINSYWDGAARRDNAFNVKYMDAPIVGPGVLPDMKITGSAAMTTAQTQTLQVAHAVGAVTWTKTGGTGATLVGGFLTPGTAAGTIKVTATDSSTVPRTAKFDVVVTVAE